MDVASLVLSILLAPVTGPTVLSMLGGLAMGGLRWWRSKPANVADVAQSFLIGAAALAVIHYAWLKPAAESATPPVEMVEQKMLDYFELGSAQYAKVGRPAQGESFRYTFRVRDTDMVAVLRNGGRLVHLAATARATVSKTDLPELQDRVQGELYRSDTDFSLVINNDTGQVVIEIIVDAPSGSISESWFIEATGDIVQTQRLMQRVMEPLNQEAI